MFIRLQRLIEWMILFIIFFLLSGIFYQMVILLNHWVNPFNTNKEPDGHSIKVIETRGAERMELNTGMLQRLNLFYWAGE